MRTTLELDDDLLAAVRGIARERGATLGQVISELAQKSLAAAEGPKMRNGFRLLAAQPGASRHDLELVNRLRDEE